MSESGDAHPDVRLAATGELDRRTLAAARGLLYEVFAGEMTEQDWEHALGGTHALLWESGELIGHGALVPREFLHGGRAMSAGYVEGVAVRGDRRRRGHGGALMAVLEEIVRRCHDLGALGASGEGVPFYTARGWKRWQGLTWGLTPSGRVRTAAEDDCVFVLEVASALDLSGELTCDWREGDLW